MLPDVLLVEPALGIGTQLRRAFPTHQAGALSRSSDLREALTFRLVRPVQNEGAHRVVALANDAPTGHHECAKRHGCLSMEGAEE